jgi:hypothetical protein
LKIECLYSDIVLSRHRFNNCYAGEYIVNPVVYACDIGSVKSGTFAWVRNASLDSTPAASVDIDDLIAAVTRDVEKGLPIALGFEAPLFLPVPDDSAQLNSGRTGETSRSMFAPAGAAVTTLGVHESAWIFKRLRATLPPETSLRFDWTTSNYKPKEIFIWEAFVSSTAHSDTHERDAATAVQYFLANIADLGAVNAVTCSNPLSLISAAALWSGWITDIEFLHIPCLVLRPAEPYTGLIEPA